MKLRFFLNHYLPYLLAVLLLAGGLFVLLTLETKQVAESAWYSSSWTYRKTILVDKNKVSGTSTLSNFPMLFSVTDSDLKHTAHGGKVGKTDGTDIVFTSSDGSTKLNHEIEKYSSSTGETIVWVQIPSLATTTDTLLYVYFGNSGASDQQNATSTWDSYYKGVYHLPNGTTLSATSSTASNNGSLVGNTTAQTGKIDGAATFDGTNDGITMGTGSDLDLTGNYTLSAWIYPDAFGGGIIGRSNVNYPAPYDWSTYDGRQLLVSGSNAGYEFEFSTGYMSTGAWNYVAVTVSGADVTFYRNGASDGTGTLVQARPGGAYTAWIGLRAGDSAEDLNGEIDEARISKGIARSSGWMMTEYANQSSPTSFYSYSAVGVENRTTTSEKAKGGIKARGGVKFK